MKPAVFLDRDGVLNEVTIRNGRPYPPATLDDVRIYPDVRSGLTRLRSAGFALIVVTNQPDVARGDQSREVVNAINTSLMMQLQLDEIRVCFHDDRDNCLCRKPRPGLLTQAPYFDLPRSFLIGDRWRDIEAGRAVGCRTVLLDRGYQERRVASDLVAAHFTMAVDWILAVAGTDITSSQNSGAT
jgi:D-glycero-D-manno-heptose 1,7-bisphosphate phosphatase